MYDFSVDNKWLEQYQPFCNRRNGFPVILSSDIFRDFNRFILFISQIKHDKIKCHFKHILRGA